MLSRAGVLRPPRRVQRLNRPGQLSGHIDVALSGLVALVPHKGLKRVPGQPVRVYRAERASQIVEAVQAADSAYCLAALFLIEGLCFACYG